MSVAYYVVKDGEEHFVMRASARDHREAAGPFETAREAWDKAEDASGPDGIYTTLPPDLRPSGNPQSRACWLDK